MSDIVKILLIDDEEEFIITLAQRLEFRGYKVKIAQDGQAGINALANECFDVVVLDFLMPVFNGIDVLKQIKKKIPDLPVILLTGHGSTKAGMEAMHLGAFDYLMKPININELIIKISMAIKK